MGNYTIVATYFSLHAQMKSFIIAPFTAYYRNPAGMIFVSEEKTLRVCMYVECSCIDIANIHLKSYEHCYNMIPPSNNHLAGQETKSIYSFFNTPISLILHISYREQVHMVHLLLLQLVTLCIGFLLKSLKTRMLTECREHHFIK